MDLEGTVHYFLKKLAMESQMVDSWDDIGVSFDTI